jgi:very-short-patch-repair endonuclease
MKNIENDIQVIRESQIRMEADLKYHIRRTDLLEEKVNRQESILQPLVVFSWISNNIRTLMLLSTLSLGIIVGVLKLKGLI